MTAKEQNQNTQREPSVGFVFKLLQFIYQFIGSWNEWGMRVKDKYFGSPMNVPPTEDTDLIIESFGGCATTALVEYVQRFNPGIKIASHVHAVNAVKYGFKHNIPVIFVSRDRAQSIASVWRRYSRLTWKSSLYLRYDMLHNYMRKRKARVLETGVVVDYEELIKNPSAIIQNLNQHYNLSYKVGDGILRVIVTDETQSVDSAGNMYN